MGRFSLKSVWRQGVGGSLGSTTGQIGSILGDPLDLFGKRAGYAAKQAANAQEQAFNEQQRAQRDAYLRQVQQQQPYYDAGVNALAQLNTPGTIPLSEQYGRDLEQGSRALNRSLAASGQFRSSNAYDKFGDFYNQLSGEEMGRQYNNALAPIKLAQDAMGAMGGAADTYGAGMSSAYNNRGNQLAQNALNYGQQRQDSFQNAGNAFNSMMNYYGSR